MAGIYLHIPFCRKACHYCDFHFSTNRQNESEVVHAMVREIELRRNYLPGEAIETIYIGGGTPSLLKPSHLEFLLNTIDKNFIVSSSCEITLEANPDDLSEDSLLTFRDLGINRLSIGIQTFNEDLLRYLNRSHSGSQAVDTFRLARSHGFNNINLDLIFGIPGQTLQMVDDDLQQVLSLNPEHISAYALTIEERTVFGNWFKKGKLQPVAEELGAALFQMVSDKLTAAGYRHYEISNYARPGFLSRHNSNYWKQVPYLGIGPGAHSFDGISRQANISNNHLYVKNVNQGVIPATVEKLSRENRINEYIMTSLRTDTGLDTKFLQKNYDFHFSPAQQQLIRNWQSLGLLTVDDSRLILTRQGKLLADRLAADLFLDTRE
ncbi:MAG: radical SAM family heme chaperone HemW [Cyclobacteriaceae bacterium]|nr:radical SAM family heme chaperone HemW [Cyclobacteriaceae bacterium]MDW8331172.1 radical SAM family heme chaperone HemW [Cyclobacteriaceae bacterium]